MQKIYIPLGNGQTLIPEVIEGILKQTIKCAIVPITSEKTYAFKNRTSKRNNWITILKLTKDKSFIGMDSDVIMTDPKTIETLLSVPDDVDLAAIMTKEGHKDMSQDKLNTFHSIIYCKIPELMLAYFEELKWEMCKKCSWCEAITHFVDKGKKYRAFKEPKATECDRTKNG